MTFIICLCFQPPNRHIKIEDKIMIGDDIMKQLKIMLFAFCISMLGFCSVSNAAESAEDYVVESTMQTATPAAAVESNSTNTLSEIGKSVVENNLVNFSVIIILIVILGIVIVKNKKLK